MPDVGSKAQCSSYFASAVVALVGAAVEMLVREDHGSPRSQSTERLGQRLLVEGTQLLEQLKSEAVSLAPARLRRWTTRHLLGLLGFGCSWD